MAILAPLVRPHPYAEKKFKRNEKTARFINKYFPRLIVVKSYGAGDTMYDDQVYSTAMFSDNHTEHPLR